MRRRLGPLVVSALPDDGLTSRSASASLATTAAHSLAATASGGCACRARSLPPCRRCRVLRHVAHPASPNRPSTSDSSHSKSSRSRVTRAPSASNRRGCRKLRHLSARHRWDTRTNHPRPPSPIRRRSRRHTWPARSVARTLSDLARPGHSPTLVLQSQFTGCPRSWRSRWRCSTWRRDGATAELRRSHEARASRP